MEWPPPMLWSIKSSLRSSRQQVENMASPGGGTSDISRQEASGLLHKLVTEKTQVQATFVGIHPLMAGLIGALFATGDGTILAKSDLEPDGPFLHFDPRAAVSFRYGDHRALSGAKVTSQGVRAASALVFIYPDKTLISLAEIPSDPGT
jgi:hypothetical protein